MTGEPELSLQRIIGVAHGAGSHHAPLYLPAQVVPDNGQGIFLDGDMVEVGVVITAAAAVAVDAAMGTAPVEIHIIIGAEPPPAPGTGDNGLCGNGLHGRTSFCL